MIGDQLEAGAGAGGEPGRTIGTAAVGDAFQPALQVPHEVRDLLGAFAGVAELLMHVEAECRQRAADIAGFVELDRLIGVLQHVGGIDAEAVAQSFLDGLHAVIEHAQVTRRDSRRKPQLVADQPDDRGDVARALGHGIGDERTETHVIAADREQHDIDGALAALHHCLVKTCSLMLVLPEL